MIEKILLPLDGSALAERALPYALRLASATKARLVLMHATVPWVIPRSPGFDVDAFARRLRTGQVIVPFTSSQGVEIDAVTHDIFVDKVAEGICQTIVEQAADLVVMATRSHGGLGRWLHGGVANQVLKLSPVPVVLVPPTCDQVWPDDGSLRILIPLDGSRFAEEILEPVGNLAATLKAELILVGASGPLESAYVHGVRTVGSGFGAALHATYEYLDDVATRLRAMGRTVVVDAEVGRPDVIIDSVSRTLHVDLIALATHGRTGVAHLAFGSVASDLLHASTVPLFLWRPAAQRHVIEAASLSTAAR
jgi:nucleotide-binding universal stress UspA family protein